MNRLVWAAVGAVAGVLVVRKVADMARRATPESVADAGTRFASTVGRSASKGV